MFVHYMVCLTNLFIRTDDFEIDIEKLTRLPKLSHPNCHTHCPETPPNNLKWPAGHHKHVFGLLTYFINIPVTCLPFKYSKSKKTSLY